MTGPTGGLVVFVQNAPPIQGVKSQHLQVSLWLGPQVATSVVFRQLCDSNVSDTVGLRAKGERLVDALHV